MADIRLTRRVGLIATLISTGGAIAAIIKFSPVHLVFFGMAIFVILIIVGNAENDNNHPPK